MAEIGGISVKITADTAGLQDGVRKAENSLGDMRKRLNAGIGTLAKYTAGVAAAGAAISVHLVNNARQAIDAQAKMAQQLGTTTASMATLARAADLSGVSLEQIRSGTRALTVRLAQAAQGTGPAVEALEQLGLTAEEVSRIPLDQRLSVINQAIRDTVPASEQAAVAARLFGEEAGTAFTQLDPEVLATAREEAELFGTALSDVDAAKVEMANDALATIGMALDGIVKQLTVQLAPALQAIGEQFKANAKEAGGFEDNVTGAFNSIIKATGFVLDAFEGIKRVFTVVADGIIAQWSFIVGSISEGVASILSVMDDIPGLDFSAAEQSVREFANNSLGVAREAVANIGDTLAAPMPSAELEQFVAQAQEKAQIQAELQVAEREQLANHEAMKTQIVAEEEKARLTWAEMTGKQRLDTLSKYLGQSSALMNSESRKMFEIGKAAAYSQALINTFQGISEAWKLGPIVGPPLAALVALNGFAQVQNIRKQSFKGGGSASAGGAAAGGGAASATQQINANNQPVSGGPRQVVNVALNGEFFSRDQVRNLLPMIGEELRDGGMLGDVN